MSFVAIMRCVNDELLKFKTNASSTCVCFLFIGQYATCATSKHLLRWFVADCESLYKGLIELCSQSLIYRDRVTFFSRCHKTLAAYKEDHDGPVQSGGGRSAISKHVSKLTWTKSMHSMNVNIGMLSNLSSI